MLNINYPLPSRNFGHQGSGTSPILSGSLVREFRIKSVSGDANRFGYSNTELECEQLEEV